MTKGLESAAKKKHELYKATLCQNSTDHDKKTYIEYHNTRLKCKLMTDYYTDKCIAYQDNTKKLRQLINRAISKEKNKGSIISSITVEGIKHYTPIKIAIEFGKFYSNIGKKLSFQNKEMGARYTRIP